MPELCDIVGHHSQFDAVSTATDTICMRFRFHPLLTAFPNRYVFDESAQRISVDGRPKRISVDGV